MDWTTIIVTAIGACVAILTIVLPIVLNRSQTKNRTVSTEENNQVKTRLDSVESHVKTIETSVEKLCSKVEENHMTTQGLHLLDIIEHRPHHWETIRQMFSAYSKMGGNGHVERVYRQWEDDYGKFYDVGEVPPSLIKK